VSQENVEIIERFHRSLPEDLARAFRDDEAWRVWVEEIASLFRPGWGTVRRSALGSEEGM
jgi:hypothetical protein